MAIREYKIWGEINEYALQCLQDFFTQNESNTDELRLTFFSEGGSVIAGNAMHDLIKNECSKRKISGRIYYAYSIAAIVVCAIPVENLEICEHGTLMFHNVKTSGFGMDEKDLLAEATIVSKMQSILENALVKRTSLSLEEVKTKFFNGTDVFVTAGESVSLGICGKICGLDSMEVVIPAELEVEIETMISGDPMEDKFKGHLTRLFNKLNLKNTKTMNTQGNKTAVVEPVILSPDQYQNALQSIQNEALELRKMVEQKDDQLANLAKDHQVQLENFAKMQAESKTEIETLKNQLSAKDGEISEKQTAFNKEVKLQNIMLVLNKVFPSESTENLKLRSMGVDAIFENKDGLAFSKLSNNAILDTAGKQVSFEQAILNHYQPFINNQNNRELNGKGIGLPMNLANVHHTQTKTKLDAYNEILQNKMDAGETITPIVMDNLKKQFGLI